MLTIVPDQVFIEKRPEHPVKSTSTMKSPSPLRSEVSTSDISNASHTKPTLLAEKKKAGKGCCGCWAVWMSNPRGLRLTIYIVSALTIMVILGMGTAFYVTGKGRMEKEVLQQETMDLAPREVTSSLPSSPNLAFYPDSLPAHRMPSPTITVVVHVSTQASKTTFITKVRMSQETNLCYSPSISGMAATRGYTQVTSSPSNKQHLELIYRD